MTVRTMDVTATGEEAVAEKRARVVEEVVVGKQVSEREQAVRDNVRRKDVDVEQISQSQARSGEAPKPATGQGAPRR